MPQQFTVSLQTHAETAIEVEADTVEAAIEKAEFEVHRRLCSECNREVELGDDWGAIAVDFDGEQIWSAEN